MKSSKSGNDGADGSAQDHQDDKATTEPLGEQKAETQKESFALLMVLASLSIGTT